MEDRPARILLIDADEGSFSMVQTLLSELPQRPYRLEWEPAYAAGREGMLRREFDLYLVDYHLGECGGIELLREAIKGGCYEPIIILTGQEEPEVDRRAMKAGAADYLVKDELDAHRLERSIRYSLERSQLLKALDHEKYLLHTLMDNVPDNIYFKDQQGRYIRINRAKAQRSGLADPEQAVGKSDFDFFPREHAQRTQRDEEGLMQSCQPIVGKEEKLIWPTGQLSWVSTTKVPFRNELGEIIGTLGVSRDITRLKRAQEDLRQAKEAAEAASRAKSDFLANMSHEIRTPMNAVLGMTELVLDTELTETQHEYLNMVRESGEALLAIINDILDFSKIEAGKAELALRPFPLRESVGNMMRSLGLRAHDKGLELAFHIDPRVPDTLVGDVNRLRQVIVNLVGNAVKFTDQGEVLVDVTLEQTNDTQVVLHFEVADTGVGVPKDKLETVFHAFEQVDPTSTRKHGGTGLGLTIATRLVRLMGGQMWAESEPDAGSRFHFTARFDRAAALANTAEDACTVALQGTRVLVVDDNQTNRRILAEMLTNWGLDVASAPSAEAAFEQLQTADRNGQPFQVLLSDVQMPETDGFALAKRVRATPSLASTQILLLTSGGRRDDLARSASLNVAAHLMKPVKQSELFNVIIKTVGAADSPEAASAPAAQGAVELSPLRILLAEDSLFNQKLAIGLLEKYGHQVAVANNGVESLEALEAGDFDLVLMDVQMPEMDGLEATEAIRRSETQRGGHLPIIAMTAHAMKGDRESCLQAGMDAYVAKPIHAQQLLQTIAEVVRQKQLPAGKPDFPAALSSFVRRSPDRPAEGYAASADAAVQSEVGIVDWDEALRYIDGRQELLVELIELFKVEHSRLLEEIEQAIEVADARRLQQTAHRLKGCLHYFGKNQASAIARTLEGLGRSETLEGAKERFQELRCEIDRMLPVLGRYAQQHGRESVVEGQSRQKR